MTQYAIGSSQPVQVQQSVASGWTLQNVGSNPIYLGNDLSVTPSTGYIVLPGVALPIQPGTVLYAIAAPNLPSEVSTVQGVQAPTVSNVNVSGPVTVAGNVNATITNATLPVTGTVNANITNASLPVSGSVAISSGNITAAISGPVSISSGTVNVGNTVTTIGASAVVYSGTQSSTASGTIGSFSGLAAYACLLININRNLNGSGALLQCNQLQINWTDASGNVLYTDNVVCSTTGFVSAAIPVRAPNVTLVWVAAGAGATSIPVTVIGTPEVQSRRVLHVPGSTSRASGVTSFTETFDLSRGIYSAGWNTVNGQTPQIILTSRGGMCRIGFSNFDSAAGHQFQIFDAVSGGAVLRHTTNGNTSDFELATTLPEGPLYLQMNNAASAVYQEALSITWDPT